MRLKTEMLLDAEKTLAQEAITGHHRQPQTEPKHDFGSLEQHVVVAFDWQGMTSY